MIIFTLRRILLLLITLFFLTLVSFSLSYFTPRAPLNGAALLDAYQFYFVSLLHWDFGVSSINGQAISEQLREVFPATMELCLLAFALALFIGIPLGIIAGVLRGKWQGHRHQHLRAAGLFDAGVLAGAAADAVLLAAPGLAAGFRPFRPAVSGEADHRFRAD